ncbi:FIG00784429: hypothetical protein [hydrothermal vent metagenome]|uniref:Methyltransferase domain-containing protein n=1 Tax=hydrothermal vent metagenome TaxID=652676 RepID=A0A3B1AKK5_9ZZZZ
MDNYRFIGPLYELLCKGYGGTAFDRCRVSHLQTLTADDRVLFAGVGHGRDAIFAAQQGARVTVVELSATMLERFKKNVAASGLGESIRTINGRIEDVSEPGAFDTVVANFFLNIYDVQTMPTVLAHLINMVRPGGSIIVGDFSYPGKDGSGARLLKNSYWFLANAMFRLLAKNPLHAIYNYPAVFIELGQGQLSIKYTKMLNMNFFWSIKASKLQ